MRWRGLIHHEWQTVLSRPAALAALAVLAGVLIYGVVTGRVARAERDTAVEGHRNAVVTGLQDWMAPLRLLEEKGDAARIPPWAGSPMDVPLASYLPSGPLGDFAVGQSDLMPYAAVVTLWDPDVRLFSRYELDDPVSLALGAFDLSKAIILVLPLALIVLSFNVVSAERDAGRMTLLLAQGATLRALLWSRLAIRAAIVFVIAALVALAAFAWPIEATSLSERLPFFALWVVVALLYGAFWVACIAVVASRNRNSASNLMLLLLAWTGFTFLMPAAAAALSEMVYPVPSRLALLADAREIEIETELAESEILNGYLAEHPELALDATTQMPAYVRSAFLATKAVDEATGSALAEFERVAGTREEGLEFLRYLSPAALVHTLFNDIAGTSARRHRQYMMSARSLKAEYAQRAAGYIVAGQRLPLKEVASLPEMDLEEETLGTILKRNGPALMLLAGATGFLVVLAVRRKTVLENSD